MKAESGFCRRQKGISSEHGLPRVVLGSGIFQEHKENKCQQNIIEKITNEFKRNIQLNQIKEREVQG